MRALAGFILAAVLCGPSPVVGAEVDIADLVSRNSYPFVLDESGGISGPGADFLKQGTENAQFVLFGESHHDHDSPRLATAIYRMLRDEHGFDVAVVELDPLAVAAMNKSPLRGDAARIAEYSRRYPTHVGFSSDQDIAFLADATALGPVWGVEQAQGATRYLEELLSLAPDEATGARVAVLLDEARSKETRATPGGFMHDDPIMLARMERLRAEFGAQSGSRADDLFGALVDSLRIYSFNRRAMEGEYVGLYNNTEREALFKRHLVREYRAASAGDQPLKAMFKFGNWHMYRGKSPGQAYTIGSFAHESAIWNDMEAYGISVLPVGGHAQWSDLPDWMRPLLPEALPGSPVLIDLRPLKPYTRLFRESVAASDQWQTRDLLQGFDAIVILPESRKATWDMTGFQVP